MPVKTRRWHPDLDASVAPCPPSLSMAPVDLALDFVDMATVVDRIHAAFFHGAR